MSIIAVVANSLGTGTHIPWLHQCYVLERDGTALSFLEFIVCTKTAELRSIDIFVPYRVTEVTDRTDSLLLEDNALYYSEGFQILDLQRKKISLEHIEAQLVNPKLRSVRTDRGTRIELHLDPRSPASECYAFRLEYRCQDVSIAQGENRRSITMGYYTPTDAILLGLQSALAVHSVFHWVVFPEGTTTISHITPPFWQQRELATVKIDRMRPFFGGHTDSIWIRLPRKMGMWRADGDARRSALSSWIADVRYCEFSLSDPTSHQINLSGKSTPSQSAGPQESFQIIVSRQDGPGTKVLDSFLEESDVNTRADTLKSNYGLFVDDRFKQVQVKGKLVAEVGPASLEPGNSKEGQPIRIPLSRYLLLLNLLANRGRLIEAEYLYTRCWMHVHGEGGDPPDGFQRTLKTEISRVRKLLEGIQLNHELEVESVRGTGYRIKGADDFCLIVRNEFVS